MSADSARASARDELRRGWPQLLACTLGCGAGVTGLPFYSLSTFVAQFERERGWSRGETGGALLALTVGMMLGAPLVGRLVAHYGARTIVLASIPLFAATLALPVIAASTPAMLWACYFAIGLLGIGTSPVAYTLVITQCFDAARGLALGLTLAGTGLAAVFLPGLVAAVAERYDASGGYISLVLIALIVWPLVWLLLTTNVREAFSKSPAPAADVASAGAHRAFVLMAAAFFLVSLSTAGVVVHLIAMMRDAGLDAAAAARVAGTVGLGVIGARVMAGWLVDRFHAPLVGAVVFVTAAGGCLLLIAGGGGGAGWAAALIGVAIGAEVDLIAFLVSRYFAPMAYARVYGWQFAVFAIGAGLSPLAIAWLRAAAGSYTLSLQMSAASLVIASLLLLMLGRYRVAASQG